MDREEAWDIFAKANPRIKILEAILKKKNGKVTASAHSSRNYWYVEAEVPVEQFQVGFAIIDPTLAGELAYRKILTSRQMCGLMRGVYSSVQGVVRWNGLTSTVRGVRRHDQLYATSAAHMAIVREADN